MTTKTAELAAEYLSEMKRYDALLERLSDDRMCVVISQTSGVGDITVSHSDYVKIMKELRTKVEEDRRAASKHLNNL